MINSCPRFFFIWFTSACWAAIASAIIFFTISCIRISSLAPSYGCPYGKHSAISYNIFSVTTPPGSTQGAGKKEQSGTTIAWRKVYKPRDRSNHPVEAAGKAQRAVHHVGEVFLRVLVFSDLLPVPRGILVILSYPRSDRDLRAMEAQPGKEI